MAFGSAPISDCGKVTPTCTPRLLSHLSQRCYQQGPYSRHEHVLSQGNGLLSLPAKPVQTEVGFVVGYGGSPRRRHLVEPLAILFGDLDSCRAQVVLQLLHSTRPDDGAGYARLLLAPGERNLPRRAPLLRGDSFDHLQDGEGFLCEVVPPHAPRF